MSDKKTKNNTGIYVAAFFLCVILLIMLFFVQKDNILSNLKKTNFFERVGVSTPDFVTKHPEKTISPAPEEKFEFDLMEDSTKTTVTQPVISQEEEIQVQADNPIDQEIIAATKAAESVKTSNYEKEEASKVVESQNPQPTKVEATKIEGRKTNLCFVIIDSEGKVNRKIITRTLPKTDSPLTEAIKALIAGPIPSESNCMNLIPAGTRLIGASVKNGVATLNFNENFEFNTYGVEGCIAQLMQIVYTATEFSTVKSVQFLIEGEKKEYLGTEGQWIGSPLSRSSF